jgi:hypothetical protein
VDLQRQTDWRSHRSGGRAVLPLLRAKQVRSFVFRCHRQPLSGHRTAQKMKHVSFEKRCGETTVLALASI